MQLSGTAWVSRFPNSKSPDSLVEPFRANAKRFLAALTDAGATVTVADTLRPPERAYLMHFAFAIAKEGFDPATVPPKAGVDIQWVHPASRGVSSASASKAAAEKMVLGYGIVFRPALGSRHRRSDRHDDCLGGRLGHCEGGQCAHHRDVGAASGGNSSPQWGRRIT